ncbi:hypothetical protein BGX24_005909 [Mortierella sp. AD032]|nr:hypothetical protein BGX24_005909 [Mortierella sp. AD032]
MNEDIEVPDAPAEVIDLVSQSPHPVSIASSLAEATPAIEETQGRPTTPLADPMAYSIKTLRPNILGGRSFVKTDIQREPSTFTEKEPKHKAALRVASQGTSSTTHLPRPELQQTSADLMNNTLNTLNATIQELREDLARQREHYEQQINELRNENRQLMTRLDQYFANTQARQTAPYDNNGVVMSTQDVAEYGGVDYPGSSTPYAHHTTDMVIVNDSQATTSDTDI